MTTQHSRKSLKAPTDCVSCSCYNKLLQTWQLGTAEVYSLTVLEARHPKSISVAETRVSAVLCFLRRLKGRISSLPLPASSGCQRILAYGHITPDFRASIFTSLSIVFSHSFLLFWVSNLLLPLTYETLVITFRAHLENPG